MGNKLVLRERMLIKDVGQAPLPFPLPQEAIRATVPTRLGRPAQGQCSPTVTPLGDLYPFEEL